MTEAQGVLIAENLRLLRVLRQLADQFQQVYESAYHPAPAGENGVYAEARQILREIWGNPLDNDGVGPVRMDGRPPRAEV
jgi:hypothetical protein